MPHEVKHQISNMGKDENVFVELPHALPAKEKINFPNENVPRKEIELKTETTCQSFLLL